MTMTSPNHHNTRFSSQNSSRNNISPSTNLPAHHKGSSNHKTHTNGNVHHEKSTVNSCKSYTPLTVALPNGSSSRISVDSNDNSIDSFHVSNSVSPHTTFNGLVQISAPATTASSLGIYKSANGHANPNTCATVLSSAAVTQEVFSRAFDSENSLVSDNLLQPFEKATQIYRYLSSIRQMGLAPPVFLQRNLSYMQPRNRKVLPDSKSRDLKHMISRLTNEAQLKKKQLFAPITLKFFSFEDKPSGSHSNGTTKNNLVASAGVKVINKFNGKPDQEIVISDEIDLPYNSPNSHSPMNITRVNTRNAASVIHIAREVFPLSDPMYSKSFLVLSVKVRSCPQSFTYSSPNTRSASSTAANSSLSPREGEAKKRKRSSALSPSLSNGPSQSNSPRKDLPPSAPHVIYVSEVPVFNEYFQLVLHTGTYELQMYKVSSKNCNPSNSFSNGVSRTHYGNENFDCEAKLHFECIMSKSGFNSPQKSPNSRAVASKNLNSSPNGKKSESSTASAAASATTATKVTANGPSNKKPAVKIIYRFFLNQTDFQQTESSTNLICPWCGVTCLQLKQLAAHLKNCHERLNFRVRCDSKPDPKLLEAIVDVVPNDSYDGSYSGNPYELSFSSTVGYAFARKGPVRRIPTTTLLVNKKGKNKFTDQDKRDSYEDLYDADIDVCRPTVYGHDRLYYHSNTCLPIRPQDMDEDSESETDPEWMRKKTQQVRKSITFFTCCN